MKNKWTLTPDAFNRLLAWLSPDREEAGRKYEEIRRKLIFYFTKRGHREPEDLADESFNRAARKLESGTLNYSGDPLRDLTGFAYYVWKEDLRKLRPEPIDDPDLFPAPYLSDREILFRCLDQCLAKLSGHSRDLLTRYHQEKGHEKSVVRQLLADEAGINLATLRIRICRMVRPVRECFSACIGKESAR